MNKFLYFLKTTFYYSLIFTTVFLFSTLALARKVNRYNSSINSQTFEVDKDEIVLNTTVEGVIQNILVQEGDHVKAGDVLVELSDASLIDRLEILEAFENDNLSARTEAEVLRSTSSEYIIRSPRDGVVKEIIISPGSNVSSNTKVLTLYSDVGANVITYLSGEDLKNIQKASEIEVYSQRLEQYFTLVYKGVNQASDELDGEYKAYFAFVQDDSSSYFFDGEKLQKTQSGTEDLVRPGEFITRLWNSLIVQS